MGHDSMELDLDLTWGKKTTGNVALILLLTFQRKTADWLNS